MKKYLVCYANEEFYKDQKRLIKSAYKNGITKVFAYSEDDIMYEENPWYIHEPKWTKTGITASKKMIEIGTTLEYTDFYKKNKETLDVKKGGGLWLWKPYVILEAMKQIKEGDLLIYADSAAEMINPVDDLIPICQDQGGIMLFTNTLTNKVWAKRDCFVLMNCDSKKYWDSSQTMGGFQVYIKNKKSMKFVKEFLKFCEMPDMLTDQLAGWSNKCGLPDLPGFRAGRNDQPVLTNLAVKYNLKLFRDPSQNGNHLKSPEFRSRGEWLNYPYNYSDKLDHDSKYPTIFYNYRGRGKFIILLLKIHTILPRWLKLLNKKMRYYLNKPFESDI